MSVSKCEQWCCMTVSSSVFACVRVKCVRVVCVKGVRVYV